MKAWDPVWRNLPPVEPVKRPAPASRELSHEEKAHNLRQYQRTHLRHVERKEADHDH